MAQGRAGSSAAAIEDAARLLATSPALAEQRALTILRGAPHDPRALLILASARRRRGDHAGALVLLEPLARAHAGAARTHYELGLARLGSGERAGGVAALRHAVSLNRDFLEAWRAVGDALFKAGDVQGSEAAFAEHRRATLQLPRLKEACDALAAEAPERAEALLRAHLAEAPQDLAALQLMGETLGLLSRAADAEVVLGHALSLDPAFDGARFTLAGILFQQQKAAEALPHLERLLARDPADPAYRNLFAACLSLVGDLDEVDRLYRGLLADFPDQPRIWLNHGHALRTVGRFEEAVEAYRRCIALAPGLGDAYWSLANLKLASFSDQEVAAIGGQLGRPDLPKADRLHLHYALGKALEDRREYAGSFEHYAAGAKLQRRQVRYSAEKTTADLDKARALFTPAFFAARAAAGDAADDPIFVVGLPRSGSTLVEQILASHPQVEGTMELPDIGLIARSLGEVAGGATEPLDALPTVSTARLGELGARYLQATRIHRKLGRPRFIDKMPNNFLHIGMIHLILPQARIIDMRRHPLGAGFSVFKQHFAQGQSFSYDLDELGRYYRDYVELMAHFDVVLPGRVCRVIYEDLVEDTEAQVRRLLAACGLEFDPACLRFYETERAVKTVSSEQVRRPIFRGGLDQWRHYEPWLGPLKGALGSTLETWREPRIAPRPL
ncbi:tetratricopeptide repeat-containing sulfotransferase family protein [Caulobacter sp. S45]|uniref:tetratricopeptide repeat-containing sulfotransferase family protein n=1 Tax=Caulobacter sp. S45 TaxID=1641861 RepID=UPI00157537FE|nr:tetratricopeptide repeat-containing sulfotransferase family protein [Caulobacter sp. S45]